MRHDAADEQDLVAEADLRDEPILVPTDVEDNVGRDGVGSVERLSHFREIDPGSPFGDSVPMIQRTPCVAMLLAKGPDRLVTDNIHQLQPMVP